MFALIRHGETDFNSQGRVQGHIDVPLNEQGRAQARELARELTGGPDRFAALYCSHLTRARETAEIIGEALDLSPIVDPRFAESARGEWEGLTWDEVERKRPGSVAAWLAAGPDFRFPGGESLQEHSDRVIEALTELRQKAHGPTLVACHGGTIRVALCHSRGVGLDHFHKFDVPNGAVVRFDDDLAEVNG